MANDLMRGRQVVIPLTNKSGGAIVEGDVVILSSGTAAAFTTTTSAALTTDMIGVAIESIANDAVGRICTSGYVAKINLSSSASLGDTFGTHSVAKQAAPHSSMTDGDFGEVIGTGTSPAAVLWGGYPYKSAVGGTGNTTSTAAYTSRPAAGTSGNMFFPSDGATLERDTGAAWAPWGPIFPLTKPPATTDFAWINQGSSTMTDVAGGVYLYTPAAAGDSLRIIKKAVPTAPYTITAMFMPNLAWQNNVSFGLTLRQSSDGKLIAYGMQLNTNVTAALVSLMAYKWTNPTTYNSSYLQYALPTLGFWMLRIKDDNSSRYFQYSSDGIHFRTFTSHSRTDYITPDEIGIFLTASNATYDAGVQLMSWKQE